MNAQVKKEEVKKEVLPINKTSVETWTMVQEVANSEIKANGKMLYIFKNFMKMYENKQLDISKDFDEKADEELKKMVIGYLEKLSRGLVASSMVTDDGIIDPRDTRDIIGFCLSIVNNIPIEGAREYGVFRL